MTSAPKPVALWIAMPSRSRSLARLVYSGSESMLKHVCACGNASFGFPPPPRPTERRVMRKLLLKSAAFRGKRSRLQANLIIMLLSSSLNLCCTPTPRQEGEEAQIAFSKEGREEGREESNNKMV